MKRQITLAAIAQESQVSLSTVSLVLRNKPGIPSETRQRVLDAAKRLGYNQSVHQGNRHLPSNRSTNKLQRLGVMVKTEPDLPPAANPFYSHVLDGIADACRRQKINLLYAHLPVDEYNHPIDEMPGIVSQEQVDGLLLVGMFLNEPFGNIIREKSLDVVLVDAYSADDMYDAVLSDNQWGARAAVHHLIQMGHRHIGIVGSQSDAYPSIRERRTGYLQVINEHNLPNPYFADCELNKIDASQATIELLQQHPQISALFGCNDEVAITAIRAAEMLGRRVPDDLSVIGFDDIDLAQHITPALSTMYVDKIEMGRLAVQLLINRFEFPQSGQVRALLRPRLIARQSTQEHTPIGSLGD